MATGDTGMISPGHEARGGVRISAYHDMDCRASTRLSDGRA